MFRQQAVQSTILMQDNYTCKKKKSLSRNDSIIVSIGQNEFKERHSHSLHSLETLQLNNLASA